MSRSPIAERTECASLRDESVAASESSAVGEPRDSAELRDPVDAAEPERPLRYKVQFTASLEFVDLLQEASDLLGHEAPQATLPEIQVRALRALVQQLRARKRGATKVAAPPAQDSSFAPEALARITGVATVTAPERVSGVATVAAPELTYPRIRWNGFDQLREGI